MDISYPDRHCEDSPTGAHYYRVFPGGICLCQHCHRSVWLPQTFAEALKFTDTTHRQGLQKAYRKLISVKPSVVKILEALEIGRIDGTMTSDELAIELTKEFVPDVDKDDDTLQIGWDEIRYLGVTPTALIGNTL